MSEALGAIFCLGLGTLLQVSQSLHSATISIEIVHIYFLLGAESEVRKVNMFYVLRLEKLHEGHQ